VCGQTWWRALADPSVALVTGSNRGLGYGIARAFHRAGYRIVSLNRTLANEEWLGEIRCDLAAPDEVAAALAIVRQEIVRLDVCVLNAAVRRFGSVAELDPLALRTSLAVNLGAPVLVVQGCLPLLRSAKGVIVVIGSHAATRYFEGGVAYSATKAGLKALVETLLLEERRNGVRATLVSPGAIANRADDHATTKMTTDAVGEFVRWTAERTPDGIALGEVEIRPLVLGEAPVVGIGRLQDV
jgi:NAD(P)-dependent dehydrogenase (short-subunit alcohol dehydrogenase family)